MVGVPCWDIPGLSSIYVVVLGSGAAGAGAPPQPAARRADPGAGCPTLGRIVTLGETTRSMMA